MKRVRRILILGIGLIFSLWLSPGQAQQETCKQCKFAECIKNSIKQKEAMRAAYEGLAQKWDRFWTSNQGGQTTPLSQIDLENLNPNSRPVTISTLKDEFEVFNRETGEVTARVGAPAGCAYAGEVEMVTNSVTCNTDMLKARAAEQAVPCKELYEIAFRHEAMHLERCQNRKGNKLIPTVLLTPAGQAREEVAAYTQEIGELKKLLEEMSKAAIDLEGRFEMKLPQMGTFVIEQKGRFPFEIEEDPPQKITGSGDMHITIDTSRTRCTVSGYNQTYAHRLEGNQEGDQLKIKFVPTGQMTIPTFRVTCPPGWGTSVPVPRGAGQTTMAKRDGEQFIVDVGAMTGSYVQGRSVATLRLCPENP